MLYLINYKLYPITFISRNTLLLITCYHQMKMMTSGRHRTQLHNLNMHSPSTSSESTEVAEWRKNVRIEPPTRTHRLIYNLTKPILLAPTGTQHVNQSPPTSSALGEPAQFTQGNPGQLHFVFYFARYISPDWKYGIYDSNVHSNC